MKIETLRVTKMLFCVVAENTVACLVYHNCQSTTQSSPPLSILLLTTTNKKNHFQATQKSIKSWYLFKARFESQRATSSSSSWSTDDFWNKVWPHGCCPKVNLICLAVVEKKLYKNVDKRSEDICWSNTPLYYLKQDLIYIVLSIVYFSCMRALYYLYFSKLFDFVKKQNF